MKKVTIITGHYGSGKTNFAVNLALSLKNKDTTIAVADLDIVNPYFRTADFKQLFADSKIKFAVSEFANSSLDVPALNLNITGLAATHDCLIIDVGGDGEGAKALGRFAGEIEKIGYEMLLVVNQYRYLTYENAVAETLEVMQSIEKASGLKCTAVVNNSNLGSETTAEIIAASAPFAEEIAEKSGLPLFKPDFATKIYVKKIWEENL